MLRSFLPVGQGAFFVEQFGNDKIVYDCGSATDVELVNDEIKSTFVKGEQIKAVFISHLHEDHVNGLRFLLKHCIVDRIYLPYLNDKERILSRAINLLTSPVTSQFLLDLIDNPQNAIIELIEDKKVPEIIYVLSNNDGEYSGGEIINNKPTIRSGHQINDLINEWVYVPFNFREDTRREQFFNELRRFNIETSDIQQIIQQQSGNNWEHLKKAYNSIPGGLNTNSMVVYSGPQASDGHVIRSMIANNQCDCCRRSCIQREAGCIYTGDYNASGPQQWSQLRNSFNSYWNQVGIIQLPHHGSMHNYNPGFSRIGCILIICSGFSNSYRHPHMKVLKDIIYNNVKFYWVNERVGTRVSFLVKELY